MSDYLIGLAINSAIGILVAFLFAWRYHRKIEAAIRGRKDHPRRRLPLRGDAVMPKEESMVGAILRWLAAATPEDIEELKRRVESDDIVDEDGCDIPVVVDGG